MIGTFTVLLAIIRALSIGEYSLYFIILKDVLTNPIKKIACGCTNAEDKLNFKNIFQLFDTYTFIYNYY